MAGEGRPTMDDDLFIAVFDDDVPDDVIERAQALQGGRVHTLASNLLLISLPGSTANPIVRMLVPEYDLTEDPTAIVVFKLNGSYSGYYHRSLWDWLESSPKGAVHE